MTWRPGPKCLESWIVNEEVCVERCEGGKEPPVAKQRWTPPKHCCVCIVLLHISLGIATFSFHCISCVWQLKSWTMGLAGALASWLIKRTRGRWIKHISYEYMLSVLVTDERCLHVTQNCMLLFNNQNFDLLDKKILLSLSVKWLPHIQYFFWNKVP